VAAYIAESVRVGELVCETDVAKAAARDRALEAQTETAPPFQPRVGALYVHGNLGGQLSVQPRIASEGGRRLDDVLGGRFAVLTTCLEDVVGLDEDAVRACEWLGIAVAQIVPDAPGAGGGVEGIVLLTEEGSRFTDWLGAAGATWTIVRPDGYVYDAGAGAAGVNRSLAALHAAVAGVPTPG
jgi:3-(3-hydroxy-phenyl)propionate hydroxylase